MVLNDSNSVFRTSTANRINDGTMGHGEFNEVNKVLAAILNNEALNLREEGQPRVQQHRVLRQIAQFPVKKHVLLDKSEHVILFASMDHLSQYTIQFLYFFSGDMLHCPSHGSGLDQAPDLKEVVKVIDGG
jgi:hypothetical protein